ncbi:Succinyl-diaminopimelate desuccinylase [Nymphon striatum]|nr:Succinyl-diaminopimelate desuccinylase [Nymphon striatum]
MIFNFRFSTEITPEELQQRVEALLDKHKLNYEIKWVLSGMPFLTAEGDLVDAAVSAIKEVRGIETDNWSICGWIGAVLPPVEFLNPVSNACFIFSALAKPEKNVFGMFSAVAAENGKKKIKNESIEIDRYRMNVS